LRLNACFTKLPKDRSREVSFVGGLGIVLLRREQFTTLGYKAAESKITTGTYSLMLRVGVYFV
jgi:hypothetical protein